MVLDAFSFALGVASWPTLIYAAAFILLTVEIAYDSGLVAFMTLVVVGALSVFFGWISLDWMVHHWGDVLLMAAVYVPVGVLWAIIKWWFFVRAQARSLIERIRYAREDARRTCEIPSRDAPDPRSRSRAPGPPT